MTESGKDLLVIESLRDKVKLFILRVSFAHVKRPVVEVINLIIQI